MNPTDTSHPDYYHRVVDCQWACPAHTDVPEYIRLIAQGRFTDAYMVNRRVERVPGHPRAGVRPALRAGLPARARRGKAGRHLPPEARRRRPSRTTSRAACPRSRKSKNGKRIACIGAGSASLTVANDLMPLGYEVDDLRAVRRARRADAHQHPVVPPAADRAQRRDRHDPRHGRRPQAQPPRSRACASCSTTAASTPCSSAPARPRARSSSCPGRAGGARQHPHRHRLARVRGLRTHRQDRRAGADHRRRQHRDGLLPHLAAPRRAKT